MFDDKFEILEANKVEQPPGLKITQGYRLLLPAETPQWSWKGSGLYWRYGVKKEVAQWLKEQVGDNCSFVEWELEGKGDWIHTGSQFTKFISRGSGQLLVSFWFRNKSKAMLFKLTWLGRL